MAAKQTKAGAPTFPSVLAFSRKFEVSDALMKSGLWNNIDNQEPWKPIELYEKRNRATFSQYGAKDEDKPKPNLSWGDNATLPHDTDTLRLNFTLKVMGQLEEPASCNEPQFEDSLKAAVKKYRNDYQFKELAIRYANNIANGRFLWSNRVGAELITIQVKHGNQVWKFNGYEYELNHFTTPAEGSDLDQLIKVIQEGLQGDRFEYLEIIVFAKLGFGQRVWPSQEMVLNIPKGEKSKILFQLNGCAAMHSEKIGNAVRTIDTWYSVSEDVRPIAIEPYGSVTSRGEAHRASRNDFYTLLGKWISNSAEVAEGEQHYIIATLIRGGVFGGKDD